MRFAASGYLWILLGIPALVLLFVMSFRARRRALQRFGGWDVVQRLTRGASSERRIAKVALVIFAVMFLVLALSRPQWGAKLETVSRRGVDVIIAVDTSLSMMAEDVKPNRLAQARGAVSSFIDLLSGDRIGLVAFSGSAYVACPLTLDYAAAKLFVDVLDTDLIPIRGTAIAEAIRIAQTAYRSNDRRYRVLILITDGEDHEGDVEGAVRDAAEAGMTIFTVGIGSPSGEPIPIRNERGQIVGYKEDGERKKVTSRLGESALEAIALASGGRYYRATTEGLELERIYDEIAGMDRQTLSSRLHRSYEDRYQLPLAITLVLLALEAAIPERMKRAVGPPAVGKEGGS